MAICGDAARYIIWPGEEDDGKPVCANHLSKALEQYRNAEADVDVIVKVLRPLSRYREGKGTLTSESRKRRLPCFFSREGVGSSYQRRFANRKNNQIMGEEEEKQDAT